MICGTCHLKRNKMGRNRITRQYECIKCARKSCVTYRPKGMNWREAFSNIVKYGTFTPPKEKQP